MWWAYPTRIQIIRGFTVTYKIPHTLCYVPSKNGKTCNSLSIYLYPLKTNINNNKMFHIGLIVLLSVVVKPVILSEFYKTIQIKLLEMENDVITKKLSILWL